MFTSMFISTIYTVNPCKFIQLIQMSDNPYKNENFYSPFSIHFTRHMFRKADETLCNADNTQTEPLLLCCQVLLLVQYLCEL